jgi:hypothetical protein
MPSRGKPFPLEVRERAVRMARILVPSTVTRSTRTSLGRRATRQHLGEQPAEGFGVT